MRSLSFFTTWHKRLFIASLALILSLPLGAAPSAEEYGTVLNLSGRQRMLTQKMTKEVCLIAANRNVADNLKSLKATRDLFDVTLAGLKDGDAEVGLPPTKSGRILRQIFKIETLWDPFRAAVDAILSEGKVSSEDLALIADSNLQLLKEMNRCVQLYEREAKRGGLESNPALAVAINLAGKQRMLTQKMTKEYMLIQLNYNMEENQYSLLDTVDLFDRTIHGLINGDDILELPPSPSEEITAQLNDVVAKWEKFKGSIAKGADEQFEATEEELAFIESANLPLLKSMNAAVKLYEKEAK